MQEFKFIHTADTSLEACWPPISLRAHALAVESYWRAFDYIIDYAIKNRVDFILHSGDIVEGEINKAVKNYQPFQGGGHLETLGRLMAGLDRLRKSKIPFIITSGSQEIELLEYLDKEGLVYYVEMSRPGRTYYDLELFRSTKIRIYGIGESSDQSDRISRLASMIDMDGIDFGILAGHVWLPELGWAVSCDDRDTNPWTAERLVSEKGIDFIGFGHNHHYYKDAKRRIYNTGSSEWCEFNESPTIFYRYDPRDGGLIETGREIVSKGFSIVSVKNGQINVDFVPIPTRSVFNLQIIFCEATPEDVLTGAVEALRINAHEYRDVLLRPILCGSLASGYGIEEVEALGDSIAGSVDALYVEGPIIMFER